MIPSPEQISSRLRRASQLANLDASRRLDTKIDMSPPGVERRLRTVSRLLALCRRLRRIGVDAEGAR